MVPRGGHQGRIQPYHLDPCQWRSRSRFLSVRLSPEGRLARIESLSWTRTHDIPLRCWARRGGSHRVHAVSMKEGRVPAGHWDGGRIHYNFIEILCHHWYQIPSGQYLFKVLKTSTCIYVCPSWLKMIPHSYNICLYKTCILFKSWVFYCTNVAGRVLAILSIRLLYCYT